MNREEAISLLHDMKDTYDEIHENTNGDIGYEQMTAIDMAIEALKAEESIEIKPTKVKGDFRIDDIDKNKRSIFEDIVWVVRCKDCRHLYNKDFCSFFGSPTDAMDYCSHGERKKECTCILQKTK